MTWDDEKDDDLPESPQSEHSVFDDYFDDPYEEYDEEYDEDDPEEHPLSTRQTRRRRNFRGDDD
jgi:hypothetical protein